MQIATSDILFLSSLCIWISMSEFLFGYLRKFPSFTFFTLDYKTYDAPLIDYEYPLYGLKYSSASAIKDTPLKLSYVYQCVGCDSFHLQSLGRAINKANFAQAVASLSKAQVKKEVSEWFSWPRRNEASEAVADEMAEHSSHKGHATKRQKSGHMSTSQS
ncbi:hypothetical protein GW17_00012148 [Ensete ventricosum]|nr:hypothetical protein GW17_00012148 [Ensete ventricosum]